MIIITWNIRGLSGPNYKRKRGRLRQELHRQIIGGTPDMLLLQEHDLSRDRIADFGSPLQGEWITLWGHGYGSEENTGLVCISIRGNWKNHIT